MMVHDRAPRLRGCRRAAEPEAAGLAVWVEGTEVVLLGGAAPAARAWPRACVHRSAQAQVSWQYQRMSSHALPPSGIIWSWGRGIPHSQHETTAVRAARASGEEVPVASAMTASPPASRAAVRACWGGAAAGACSDRGCPRCARLCAPTSSREMPRRALARRPASVALVGLVVILVRGSPADAARAVLPPYATRRGPHLPTPPFRVGTSGATQQTKPAGANVPSANPLPGALVSCAGCGWEGRRRPGGSRRRTGSSWRNPTGRPRQ